MKLSKPEPGQPTLIGIGERMLEIRYPLGVLKELDREHGISLFKGATFGEVMQDPEKLITVLYFGLKTKQPEVTREWVEENVDATMFPTLWPYLMFAMSGRWSKELVTRLADDGEESASPLPPPPTPATVSTGSPSGVSGVTTLDSVTANSGR